MGYPYEFFQTQLSDEQKQDEAAVEKAVSESEPDNANC